MRDSKTQFPEINFGLCLKRADCKAEEVGDGQDGGKEEECDERPAAVAGLGAPLERFGLLGLRFGDKHRDCGFSDNISFAGEAHSRCRLVGPRKNRLHDIADGH